MQKAPWTRCGTERSPLPYLNNVIVISWFCPHWHLQNCCYEQQIFIALCTSNLCSPIKYTTTTKTKWFRTRFSFVFHDKAKRTQQENLLHFISTKHDMNEEGRSWLLWQLVKARESNLVLTLLSDTSDKEIQKRQYRGPDSQSGVREVKKEGGNC